MLIAYFLLFLFVCGTARVAGKAGQIARAKNGCPES
jgi:hypothetical protein